MFGGAECEVSGADGSMGRNSAVGDLGSTRLEDDEDGILEAKEEVAIGVEGNLLEPKDSDVEFAGCMQIFGIEGRFEDAHHGFEWKLQTRRSLTQGQEGILPRKVIALLLAASIQQASLADLDTDGLPDLWEIEGKGPIDPKTHGCKPGRADLFILFRMRSTMTQAKIQPTLDRVVRFFASLPYTNPDGSKGIHAIPIVPPAMPKETDNEGYIELYERAMPKEWRGLAHGVMLSDSSGGGGQANRPDWCGTGYNWPTIVHELGHQFGLGHDPMGSGVGSPFHPSLMNYDYSYQLGGDGNAIQYSSGRFARMRMKETDLNETVPFAADELKFLSLRPYFFDVKPVRAFVSHIDWNRNGVFGENHVQADINDGYSVEYREGQSLEKSAGMPALVSLGDRLVVATVTSGSQKPTLFASRENPCEIKLQVLKDKKSKPIQKVGEGATGDVSIVSQRGKLLLAYPTATGIAMRSLVERKETWQTEKLAEIPFAAAEVSMTNTPNGAAVAVWKADDKTIWIGEVGKPGLVQIDGLTSKFAVPIAWNSKNNCLAIVETLDQDKKPGRMRIHHLRLAKGKWTSFESIWVEGEKGGAATGARPVLLFDGGTNRGPNGGYNVYCKGYTPDPQARAVNWLCKQIEDKRIGEGWRIRMMGNEWAFSFNPPAVAFHQGDIAYAYRLGFGGDELKTYLCFRASGIEDRFLTDFDEVSYVFKTGLKQSLESVRTEQGII